MQKFRTVIIFPDGFAEERYEFEAPATFLSGPPARIVDTFLTSVGGALPLANSKDAEINFSVNHRLTSTVTASGSFARRDGEDLPFILMISKVSDHAQQK